MWRLAFLFTLYSACAQTIITPDLVATWGKASSVFNPSNISGMLVWLQGDSLSNNANGTSIALWPDISGNGNHFTNETSARQPYISNNVVNGKSAVRFAGTSSDFRWLSNNTGFATSKTNAEIFFVLRSEVAVAGANAINSWGLKPASASESAHPNTTSKIQVQFANSVGLTYSANVTNNYGDVGTVTNWHFWNCSVSNNEVIARYNGDVVLGLDFLTNTAIGFSNKLFIGRDAANGNTWNGMIAEMMMYDHVLATNERANIYSFLSNRYSLTYTNPNISITPSNFAGLKAWWSAADISAADGAQITNWVDRVNGIQWTNMAAGTTRPLYKSSLLNGLPCVQFLGTASNQTMKSTQVINLTNYTLITIASYTNSGNPFTSNNVFQWLTRVSGNQNWGYANPQQVTATFPRPTNQVTMDVWTRTGSTLTMIQNATNAASGTLSGAVAIDQMMTPAAISGRSSDAIISDIVIFQQTVTPEQIAKLYYLYFRPRFSLP